MSLFDGISCGKVALDRAGIKVKKYYASEIDKFAMQVSEKNHPDIIQLGDVTSWRSWDIDWENVGLLIGGSPCQGFSFAGKQLNFNDDRSKLFFVYVDILNHIKSVNPDVKFLLENVKMKTEWQDVISGYLGVKPIRINSALVSAAKRDRLYWANFDVEMPDDKGITFDDINQHFSDGNKYRYLTNNEAELAMTLPVDYTAGITDRERARCLGNGWTVDVIVHIFTYLNR